MKAKVVCPLCYDLKREMRSQPKERLGNTCPNKAKQGLVV